MIFLDAEMKGEDKKFKRRAEEMTKEEFLDYQNKLSKSRWDIMQCEPIVCKLLRA